ncbi:MAG: hypothetical protein WBP89_08885 [Sedimenticolaceae bacterium]
MKQTPEPTVLQFNLDLAAPPRHAVPEDQHEALIEALSQLLLEACGHEEGCAKKAMGGSNE